MILFQNIPFSALIERVFVRHSASTTPSRVYLRSVGANPRKQVADVFAQWPALCGNGRLQIPGASAAHSLPR
jgi:hypothetical protein